MGLGESQAMQMLLCETEEGWTLRCLASKDSLHRPSFFLLVKDSALCAVCAVVKGVSVRPPAAWSCRPLSQGTHRCVQSSFTVHGNEEGTFHTEEAHYTPLYRGNFQQA